MLSNKTINKNIGASNLVSHTKSLILLMKPRVMSLVIFTCAVGLITSDPNLKTLDSIISIILVAMGAGAAGCLNMWYEADLDALMTRTCLRPIPTGKINKKQALIFGVFLSVFSVSALYYFTNLLSAFLLLFTIVFYLFVYTIWLKRKTSQNIVIGGIAGSLPPVIGWAISIFGNAVVTSYFYGFSFMDFSNERNRLSIKESVNFIRKKCGIAIGIGLVFYCCLLIPIIGSFLASLLSIISLTAATLSVEEMNINSTNPQSS